jgi:hypothetical protein
LYLNQTIDNTYIFKLLIFDKPNSPAYELEERGDNDMLLMGENLGDELILRSEISITLLPEEIYLMKKFLDVF